MKTVAVLRQSVISTLNGASHLSPATSQEVSATPGSRSESVDAAAPVALSIVSNSRILREGLLVLLVDHMDLRPVGGYTGSPPAGIQLPNPTGHVVLVDGGIGREAAITWTQHWRSLMPPAHVLVVELTDDTDIILDCIQAGAGGYTLQGASAVDVAEAIKRIQQGLAQCSSEVTAQLFGRLATLSATSQQHAETVMLLTARELEVLHYITQDYSNQEIAAALVIGVCTVKHHVHNILEKLQLRHRWEAARVAAERGWLKIE